MKTRGSRADGRYGLSPDRHLAGRVFRGVPMGLLPTKGNEDAVSACAGTAYSVPSAARGNCGLSPDRKPRLQRSGFSKGRILAVTALAGSIGHFALSADSPPRCRNCPGRALCLTPWTVPPKSLGKLDDKRPIPGPPARQSRPQRLLEFDTVIS